MKAFFENRLPLHLALGLLIAAIIPWLAGLQFIDSYGQQDHAQSADVIIVLGAEVYPSGVPGPSLARRTQHAVALYRRGLAAQLICSGGIGKNPPAESVAAFELARQEGVPASAILTDTNSGNTEESAQKTVALMRVNGWTHAIVVSDSYHLFRASLLFRYPGITIYTSPAQTTVGPMRPWDKFVQENRELLALLWYEGKTMLGASRRMRLSLVAR